MKKMNKPKLADFIEPIYSGKRKVADGINFAKYAFALTHYIDFLEQQFKAKARKEGEK